MNARWSWALGLSLATLVVASARADIAPPALEDVSCPRGAVAALPEIDPGAVDARGRPLRPWPYCAASVCTTNSDCSGGMVCSDEEIGLCVEAVAASNGQHAIRSVRERGCEADGRCLNMQSTCERARRCVQPDAAAPAPHADEPPAADPPAADPPAADPPAADTSESSAGCSVHPSGRSSSAWPLALVSLLGLIALRRR